MRLAKLTGALALALWMAVPGSSTAQMASGAATKPPADQAPTKAGEDTVERELERFRAMLKDPFSNPGYLFVDRGEQFWKKPAGPKSLSLETCDLGKGPGKLDGAFAELPRYFADADRVMDLEARILWCIEKIQGRDPKQLVKTKFSSYPDRTSELEDLTAFVSNKSNGFKIKPQLSHPKEKEAFSVGYTMFFRRQGPWDFSCATCHQDNGKRIRLQSLPTFGNPKQAQEVMGTWPAYRVSQNTLRTMQHRLYDCFWQMRLPSVDYGSDITIALTTFLMQRADGGEINVPSIKR